MNWEKITDKIGSALINACLIVFGGVVVNGLFGDGSDKLALIWAATTAGGLLLAGIAFCGINYNKKVV